jgi:hypothetical protein
MTSTGESIMRALTSWILAAVTATLVLGSSAINRQAVAQDSLQQVAQALLEFETNVTWESVSPAWRGKRDTWVATVRGSSTPTVLANQLLALEQAMGWHSVEEAWRGRRDGWVAEVQSARSAGVIARALLELERNTLWSAVGERWRARRDPWIARLRAVG